jgi:hypothetical protein
MDDEALRVVRILVDHGCEPGADYDDAEAQIWFAEANLDEEIELGLIVARDKDWLIMPPDRPGKFLITQAGFDAARDGS